MKIIILLKLKKLLSNIPTQVGIQKLEGDRILYLMGLAWEEESIKGNVSQNYIIRPGFMFAQE